MSIPVILSLCALAALSLIILQISGVLKNRSQLITAVILVSAAFIIRYFCMDHVTLDYENFLSRWVAHFRSNGGFKALSGSVGNYNLPYLYFLAAFSQIDFYDLHLIKLLSIAFDVLLAFSIMKLSGIFTKSAWKRLFAFTGTLLLPTVILNGAYWGQCDSIYAAFAVLSVYFALDNKPSLSIIAIALSFAFKLQAIFVMPLFFILLFCKKIRIRHFLLFPLTYLISALPAVFYGRPLPEIITLYIDQADSVGSGLNYNSPSIFAVFRTVSDPELAATLAIASAFAVIFLIYFWCYLKRKNVTNEAILGLSLLFCIAVPLLLPHMHDRYFFLADVFSLAFGIVFFQYFIVPALCSFASVICYCAYLVGRYIIMPYNGTWALLIVVAILLCDIAIRLHSIKIEGNKLFR